MGNTNQLLILLEFLLRQYLKEVQDALGKMSTSAPLPAIPKGETKPQIGPLSEREQQVFDLLRRGLTVKEIGQHLGIAIKTVYEHRKRIRAKLNLPSEFEMGNPPPHP